jgi:hypothetical protein
MTSIYINKQSIQKGGVYRMRNVETLHTFDINHACHL